MFICWWICLLFLNIFVYINSCLYKRFDINEIINKQNGAAEVSFQGRVSDCRVTDR